MDKLQLIKQKITEFEAKTAAKEEIKAFTTLVLSVLKASKETFDNITEENLTTIKQAIAYLEQEHVKLQDNVSQVTEDAKKDFDNQVKELKTLIERVKNIPPVIIEKTEVIRETPIVTNEIKEVALPIEVEVVVAEINDLPIEPEFQIDASHIKNLPKPVITGGGSRLLQYLADVNIQSPANNEVLKYNSTTHLWENGTGGGGGGSPGGTGTEVQYRAGASTFGAVTNSAVSGAQISFGGGIVSDYLMNLDGTSTGDYSRVLNITQNNNSAEDTYAIYVDNTVNRGTLTTGETTTLRNEYDSLVPTVNAVNAIANMYNKDLYLNVSGATLGDSDLSASVIRAYGIQNIIEGTPVINQTGSDELAQQNIHGNVVSLNITPTLTSVVDAQGNYSGSTNTVIVNSAGNANFQATAIGFSNSVGGNLTTTGNTSHYGVLNSVSGTAVNNYGMYITVFGATNNYGLIVNQGTVGFGVAAPTGQLEVRATTEQVRVSYDASNYLSTTVSSTGSATLNLTGTSPEFTFSDPVNVPDDAYGAGWNGSTEVPTKNAIYDKIETLGGSADYKYYVLAGGYI